MFSYLDFDIILDICYNFLKNLTMARRQIFLKLILFCLTFVQNLAKMLPQKALGWCMNWAVNKISRNWFLHL